MRRALVALALLAATGAAFAQGLRDPFRFGDPFRERDPFEQRDPLKQPPALNPPLPDLGDSGSGSFRDEHPRPLPDLPMESLGPRSERPVGPWYWEEQPLYAPRRP